MNHKLLISCAWNLVFTLGVAVLAYGLWLAWRPLGFIAAGIVIAIVGYGGNFEMNMKGRR